MEGCFRHEEGRMKGHGKKLYTDLEMVAGGDERCAKVDANDLAEPAGELKRRAPNRAANVQGPVHDRRLGKEQSTSK